MSQLRLIRSELCLKVERVEVLTIESEDGTWLFDKIKLHTRKGIIEATCDSQMLSHMKLTIKETQDD